MITGSSNFNSYEIRKQGASFLEPAACEKSAAPRAGGKARRSSSDLLLARQVPTYSHAVRLSKERTRRSHAGTATCTAQDRGDRVPMKEELFAELLDSV